MATRIIEGLRVDRVASERLLTAYGPFAATERLLMDWRARGRPAGDARSDPRARDDGVGGGAAGRGEPLIESFAADPRLTVCADRIS